MILTQQKKFALTLSLLLITINTLIFQNSNAQNDSNSNFKHFHFRTPGTYISTFATDFAFDAANVIGYPQKKENLKVNPTVNLMRITNTDKKITFLNQNIRYNLSANRNQSTQTDVKLQQHYVLSSTEYQENYYLSKNFFFEAGGLIELSSDISTSKQKADTIESTFQRSNFSASIQPLLGLGLGRQENITGLMQIKFIEYNLRQNNLSSIFESGAQEMANDIEKIKNQLYFSESIFWDTLSNAIFVKYLTETSTINSIRSYAIVRKNITIWHTQRFKGLRTSVHIRPGFRRDQMLNRNETPNNTNESLRVDKSSSLNAQFTLNYGKPINLKHQINFAAHFDFINSRQIIHVVTSNLLDTNLLSHISSELNLQHQLFFNPRSVLSSSIGFMTFTNLEKTQLYYKKTISNITASCAFTHLLNNHFALKFEYNFSNDLKFQITQYGRTAQNGKISAFYYLR